MALTLNQITVGSSKQNSGKTVGRPFTKGFSGNPSGRPRHVVDVTELARAHTTEAIKTLVDALRDPRHKIAAAVALLDRGWGKPHVAITTDNQHTVLHLVAAEAVGDTLLEGMRTGSATPLIEAVIDGDDAPPTE